jgi:hypothetical protein
MKKESELRLHWAELQELEEMAAELIVTALKVPAGVERRDSLRAIGTFQERIASMKRSELGQASTMLRLKGAC